MSQPRLLPYLLALIFLGLLGTGVYVYQNFPLLLQQQLALLAREYGVETFQFDELQVNSGAIQVGKLDLAGTYQGYSYTAALGDIELHYDWRMLMRGRVQSLTVNKLILNVTQAAQPSAASSSQLDIQSLLPQSFVAQLPADLIHFKQVVLDYHATDSAPILASGSVKLAGQLEAQVTTTFAGSGLSASLHSSDTSPALDLELTQHNASEYFSTLSAQLHPLPGNAWEWRIQAQWDSAPLLAWLRRLTTSLDLADVNASLDNLAVQGTGELTATIQHPNQLALPFPSGMAALYPFQASLQLNQNITRLDYPHYVEGLAGTLAATLRLDSGNVDLTAAPFVLHGNLASSLLTLPHQTQQWLGFGELVPIAVKSGGPMLLAQPDADSWDFSLGDVELTLGTVESQIQLQGTSLTGEVTAADDISATAQLRTQINTRIRQQQLPAVLLELTQNGSEQQSAYTLELEDTTQSVRIHGQGNLNLSSGVGAHQVTVLTPDLPYFSQLLMPQLQHFELVQADVAINSGKIALETHLQTTGFSTTEWSQESRLSIQNLSGSSDEQTIEDLTVKAQWNGIERWQTLQPVTLDLRKLDSGLVVKDIRVQLNLPKPTPIAQPALIIDSFHAGIFEGSIDLPSAQVWDFSAPSNTITLRAQNWQLAAVVALQQDENIQASGELEGKLPVTLANDRIVIEQGFLKALPPGGSIRYNSDEAGQALKESSKELAMALDLLSNFQYQTLSTEVALDAEGVLLLGLSLAGRNPDRYDGKPINFNINLEQNIDPLLQSLRLSDTLVQKIEHRLK